MNRITRNSFIKNSITLAGFYWLNPGNSLFAQERKKTLQLNDVKEDLFKRLILANDGQVALLLQAPPATKVTRKIGYDIAFLTAAYCTPASAYHSKAVVVDMMEKLASLLLTAQAEDGTVNLGNLESPPDTAFLLEPLTSAAFLLHNHAVKEIESLNSRVKQFIVHAAEALTTGGVHTPNHRWVICAALAKVHRLYPNKKYIDRIEEWLGEGIFIDADGHYPERSMNYGAVENNSLITMARLLNKPALLEPVRKNLKMTYYYMEPNGDLVTVDSRRQDQYSSKSIVSFYLQYRYIAVKDNDKAFAAVARLIETMAGFDEEILNRSLFHFLEDPILQKELPASPPPPDNYEKLFSTSHLLRIRRANSTTTFFGGTDWPIIIASGRSNSPNFYSFRKGNAVLKYLRLSSNFFSMGYFYSEGLKKENGRYMLQKKLSVPYYQPLPKNLRNSSGDYKLSPSIDDRFWNKMDFGNRPVSNVKSLETRVTLSEAAGKNELTFDISGQKGVQVTIELCFKEGGRLSGITAGENGNAFLTQGFGSYAYDGDSIEFGPGSSVHKEIAGLEGERYSTHFGSLRTEGMHVYLTGVTPFHHTLTFR